MIQHLAVLEEKYGLNAIAVDDARGRLAVADDLGGVRIWTFRGDGSGSKNIAPETLEGILYDVAWLPSREAVAVVGKAGLFVFGTDAEVRVELPQRDLQTLAVVDENRVLVAGADQKLRLLHLPDGRPLGAVPCGERNSGICRRPGGAASTFAVAACFQAGSQLCWAELHGEGLVPGKGAEMRWTGDFVGPP